MKPTAVILIDAERSAMTTLGEELAKIDAVETVYGVTGEWDFVALMRLDTHAELRHVLADQIQTLPGVARTQTLVALDRYTGDDGTA